MQLVQRLLPDWHAAEPGRGGGGGPAGAVFSAPVHAAEDDRAGDERALVRGPRRSTRRCNCMCALGEQSRCCLWCGCNRKKQISEDHRSYQAKRQRMP